MLKYQIIKPIKQSFSILLPAINRCYSTFPNQVKDNEDDEDEILNARKLKKWRKTRHEDGDSVLSVFSKLFNNKNKNVNEENKLDDNTFKWWYKTNQLDYLKWSQRYITERHQTLGNQLAATHFILHRNGKIKQKGAADYTYPEEIEDLPVVFTTNWWIEEIDMSGTEICYEGLENFKNLITVRKAFFRNCKYFDDWCLEKFLCECPKVEYLDVSDCENVTERGIEGLYRSWHLKHLVVTNYNHGAAFELTCLMLEDCMPGLKIEIKTPTSNQSPQ